MIRAALRWPAVVPTLSTVFALSAFSASPAAAQGTMTPSQPPPEPSGTPNEPPPLPPAPPTPPPEQPTLVGPAGPAAPNGEPVAEEERRAAPKARTGFQVAVRTGVTVPIGSLRKNVKLSDNLGVQIPFHADVGAKIIPQLFLGGYVGVSIGAVGDTLSRACDQAYVSCSSVGLRFGLQAQYHLIPDGKVNPWIGYGIGYEIAGVSGTNGGNKVSAALGGVEFAHIMAGADFRISRIVGIGPFADFALGQYSIASAEETRFGQTLKRDGDIRDKALHAWLTLGVKVTFFP
jgi:hypothetical protein